MDPGPGDEEVGEGLRPVAYRFRRFHRHWKVFSPGGGPRDSATAVAWLTARPGSTPSTSLQPTPSHPTSTHLATTIETWWPAIEAALITGDSNARAEGYNRLAKHQGPNAFGFGGPVNQRRRIRWTCSRKHRRASAKNSTLPG